MSPGLGDELLKVYRSVSPGLWLDPPYEYQPGSEFSGSWDWPYDQWVTLLYHVRGGTNANGQLPTDPGDPRIVDDDGDGNPGITVSIKVTDDLTGELYIARREIFAYEAFLTEPDLLAGTVTDDSEQLVIGASDPIFASSPANWGQFPDLSKSPILLRRVDADWDCQRLAAERDTLFPPTPEVDW